MVDQSSVIDAFDELLAAAEMVKPTSHSDEGIDEIVARSPNGHPVREVAARAWKCEACGGVGPLIKLRWLVSDRGNMKGSCSYCGSNRIDMFAGNA